MRRFMLIAAVLPPVFACGDALAINISPSESPYAILEPQTVSPPAPGASNKPVLNGNAAIPPDGGAQMRVALERSSRTRLQNERHRRWF